MNLFLQAGWTVKMYHLNQITEIKIEFSNYFSHYWKCRGLYPQVIQSNMNSDTQTLPEKLGETRISISNSLAVISQTSRLDADLLLSFALQVDRQILEFQSERVLNEDELALVREIVSRRLNGEPMSYITGFKEFWSLPVRVSPVVLVPRPETELLVERVLQAAGDFASPRIADLGTGSGAVSLALASELPNSSILATDISEDALRIAQKNQNSLGFENIGLIASNWFGALRNHCFHIVCSNPPYVEENDPCLSDPAIRHEPRQALVGGADGLESIQQIVESAGHYLVNHGWLLLEHGWNQGSAVRAFMKVAGFERVTTFRDIGGNERITEGQCNR